MAMLATVLSIAERNELVVAYKHLAERGARALKKRNPDLNVDDLISDAYEVLIQCAETYDPSKGEFEPYAASSIRFELRHRVRQHHVVKPPRREPLRRMAVYYEGDEVAADRIKSLSMTHPFGQIEARIDAERLLAGYELTDAQKEVLTGHLLGDETLRAVGASIGYSHQTAANYRDKIVADLRKRAASHRADRSEQPKNLNQLENLNQPQPSNKEKQMLLEFCKMQSRMTAERCRRSAVQDGICMTHVRLIQRGFYLRDIDGRVYNEGAPPPIPIRRIGRVQQQQARYPLSPPAMAVTSTPAPAPAPAPASDLSPASVAIEAVKSIMPSTSPLASLQREGRALQAIGEILEALSEQERARVISHVSAAFDLKP